MSKLARARIEPAAGQFASHPGRDYRLALRQVHTIELARLADSLGTHVEKYGDIG